MSSAHRTAILEAATEVFSRFGFKKASVDDIARRAGIGKGTVYLHFGSKEELFATVARDTWGRVFEEIRAALRQARTPDAKLRAYCRGRLEQVAAIARTLNVDETIALEAMEAARPFVHEFREKELKLVESILAEGNEAKVFSVRKPRAVAVGLLTWLEALVPIQVRGGAEERAGIDVVLDAILRGLAA